ncbi:MAG: DUF4998 domain-containing protein [Rikenellaceae bacterium]
MKNFLKSTAIFACLAVLFCACGDDDTKDLEIPIVESSTIEAVLSGDSRALVKWSVPDDQNITQCLITWTNNKNVDEIRYVDVIPGYSSQYEFDGLIAGDYDLTITNLGANRLVIDKGVAKETTYIYSSETYPDRPRVLRVLTEYNQITVTWNNVPVDCQGVKISYTDTLGESKVTGLISDVNYADVGAGTVATQMNDAEPGSLFYYETAFLPELGLDTIFLEASTSPSTFSGWEASDPESVSATGGCDPATYENADGAYFVIRWTVPSNDVIKYSTIYLEHENGTVYSTKYGNNGEFSEIDGDNITEGNINIRYYDVPEQGYYTIYVQNEKEGGLVSDKIAVEGQVLAYNKSTFELPEAYEMLNQSDDLTISWYDAPAHFSSMKLTYDSKDTDEPVTSSSVTANSDGTMNATSLSSVVVDGEIIMEITYLPENGRDEVVITTSSEEGTNLTVPGYASNTPANSIVLLPGCNDTYGGAYIKVNWDLLWKTTAVGLAQLDAEELLVCYMPSTERTPITSESLLLTTTEYIITGVDPDIEYTVYLISRYDGITQSEKVESTVNTYDYNSYTTADCPEASGMLLNGVMTFYWDTSDLHEDLKSVTITYNGTSKTTYVENDYLTPYNPTANASNMSYTFDSAVFKPWDGIDEITVAVNESVRIVEPDIYLNNGVYEIYSSYGLDAFADLINGSLNFNADVAGDGFPEWGTTNADINGKLMVDVDISSICSESSRGWTPMGTTSAGAYTGTFDGNYKTVTGLSINYSSGYQGFFGYVTGATIKNVTLNAPEVITSASYAGTFAAYATNSSFTGCTSEMVSNGGIVQGYQYVGGLVGYSSGSSYSDCHNIEIPVEATWGSDGSTTSNWGYAGGLVGYFIVSDTNTAVSIGNCSNSGEVTAYIRGLGGITAYSGSGCTIYGSHNLGDVRTNSFYLGGIAGQNYGNILGCYNTGIVGGRIGVSGAGGSSGGIVGIDSSSESSYTYVVGCYSTGTMEVTDEGSSAAIGGLIGNVGLYTMMYGCYFSGEMDLSGTSTARRGYITGGNAGTRDASYYSYCYYIDREDDLPTQGDPKLADTATTTINAEDIAGINSAVSTMNGAISTGLSKASFGLYGYTYAAGTTVTPPTLTITEK